MDSGAKVRVGSWANYDVKPQSGGYANVITVTDSFSTAFQVFVGVAFGAAWPYASDILVRSWAWAEYLYYTRGSKSEVGTNTERESLLDRTQSLARGQHGTSGDVPASEGPIDQDESRAVVIYDSNSPALSTNVNPPETNQRPHDDGTTSEPGNVQFKTDAKPWWPHIVLTGILAVAALSYAIAGSLVTEVPVNTSGLSNSEICGSWDLKKNADQMIKNNDDLIQAEKEARAGQYGRDCYGARSLTSPDRCTFFESPYIEYTAEKVDCPFECPDPDKCICANGIYGTAVQLSTGLTSARALGLNGPRLPKFNRTTKCVPLNMNYGFVVDKSNTSFEFEYHLGSINASGEFQNYTFSMFGTPFDWHVPAYSISAYEATPSGEEHDAWNPISDLARPPNTFITALFISPCRIVYTGRCEDYIFAATDEIYGEDWPPHRFYNPDPRARVLVCIDQMDVCTHDEKHCFPADDEHPEYGIEYEITRTAMRKSSTFRSIRFRLGSALVATGSISDFESRQLDNEQWIIESKALFNTSLARLQHNALDIAIGERPTGEAAAGFEDAYEDTTPSWARGKMCGKYKFNLPRGYSNINIAASIGILAAAFLICVFSLNTGWTLEEKRKPWLKGKWMFFDTSIWGIIFALRWTSKAPAKVKSLVQRLRGHLP